MTTAGKGRKTGRPHGSAYERVFWPDWSGHGGCLPCAAIVCTVLIFSLHGAACGQTGGEKVVLDLSQVITMAISASPEMAEKRSEAAAAKSDLAQAGAGYYPQLDATAIAGPINDARRPEVASGGRIIDPSSSQWNIGVFGRLNFTMTQPLYTFGKISNRRDAAAHGVVAPGGAAGPDGQRDCSQGEGAVLRAGPLQGGDRGRCAKPAVTSMRRGRAWSVFCASAPPM